MQQIYDLVIIGGPGGIGAVEAKALGLQHIMMIEKAITIHKRFASSTKTTKELTKTIKAKIELHGNIDFRDGNEREHFKLLDSTS